MAFQSKISFVELNKAGTLVTVKNTTGLYSAANPTGFGGPNLGIASVEKIIVGLKAWNDCDISSIELTTEDKGDGTIQTFIEGQNVVLSSMNLVDSVVPFQFDDDVYELTSYTVEAGNYNGEGNIGFNYIIIENANTLYKYDAIIIGDDDIYLISKEQQANSNNRILYLERQLCEEGNTFRGVYFAVTEFLNTTKTNMCLAASSYKVEEGCGCDDTSKLKSDIGFVQRMMLGAQMAFDRLDYSRSSEFIQKAYFSCKCNCI